MLLKSGGEVTGETCSRVLVRGQRYWLGTTLFFFGWTAGSLLAEPWRASPAGRVATATTTTRVAGAAAPGSNSNAEIEDGVAVDAFGANISSSHPLLKLELSVLPNVTAPQTQNYDAVPSVKEPQATSIPTEVEQVTAPQDQNDAIGGRPRVTDEIPPQRVFGAVALSSWKLRTLNDTDGSPPPVDQWLIGNGDGAFHVENITSAGKIPRIINKVFLQNEGGFADIQNMTPSLRRAHASWTKKNPGYATRYFDLHRCRVYLSDHFHPVFLRAFDCLQAFAYKADFFRYALIYREGGWYSDWKQLCLANSLLDRLSGNGTVWFSAIDIYPNRMQNSFIGARPRHPILEETLRSVLVNVHTTYYGNNTLYPTGPRLLMEVYRKLNTSNHSLGGTKLGSFTEFFFKYEGKKIIRHKCRQCGGDQSWATGNNYNTLWRERRMYCEDARSLLASQVDAARVAKSLERGIGLQVR